MNYRPSQKSLALFLIATLAIGAAVVSAQDPAIVSNKQPSGPLVKLSMIVTDHDNHSIDEIRKEDVRVAENGIEQTIALLEPDKRPIDYGLVIDSSGSFKSVFGSALEAAKLIVNGNRASDETFIERFISSDKVEKVQDFTGDKTQLLEALASIRIEGGLSAVLDAIHVGAAHTAERNAASQEHRKALVLITDGEDRNSFYKLDDVVKFLREVNVQVFVIGIVAQLDQNSSFIRLSPREKAENLLKRIAEESGGRIFLPRNNTELLRATNEIIHDLHGQFILNYQSTNDSKKKGFRKVDVKVIKADGEKLKVITPLGYFVDTPSAASKPK